MAEYIEREAVLTDIMNRYCMECDNANGTRCLACWVEDMNGEIVNASAADVVEVVRCKDCDKSVPSNLMGCGWRFCMNNSQHHKDEHFCGYGERREENET